MSVKFGDPFFFGVRASNVDGTMDNFDVDSHPGAHSLDEERAMLSDLRDDVQEYGGEIVAFVCVPIARFWTDDAGDANDTTNAPSREVSAEITTTFERMLRAGAAIGANK